MSRVTKQQRSALRHVEVKWSGLLKDPRQARGQRHEHLALLVLLVAAFACGKKGLRQVEEVSEDVGARVRQKLGLPRHVSDSTLWRLLAAQVPVGFRETVQVTVQALLKRGDLEPVALPAGVMSFDGKSLYSSSQREVSGLEQVAYDEKGTERWSLGAMRAVLTSVVAAPCVASTRGPVSPCH